MKKNNLILFPKASPLDRLKKIMAEAQPVSAKTVSNSLVLQQILESILRLETLLKKSSVLIFRGLMVKQRQSAV